MGPGKKRERCAVKVWPAGRQCLVLSNIADNMGWEADQGI